MVALSLSKSTTQNKVCQRTKQSLPTHETKYGQAGNTKQSSSKLTTLSLPKSATQSNDYLKLTTLIQPDQIVIPPINLKSQAQPNQEVIDNHDKHLSYINQICKTEGAYVHIQSNKCAKEFGLVRPNMSHCLGTTQNRGKYSHFNGNHD